MAIPFCGRWSAGMCSSSLRRTCAASTSVGPGAVFLTMLLITACSSASRRGAGAALPATGAASAIPADSTAAEQGRPTPVTSAIAGPAPTIAPARSDAATREGIRETDAPHGSGGPGDLGVEFPSEALDLLARSTRDSCAICAERHRKEAFDQLDVVFRAGRILTSTLESRFVRVAGGEDELALTSYSRPEPKLTFRFHSASSHLVGIAEGDLTEEVITRRLLSAAEDARYQGAIEIVPYAYGDRATYLYSSSRNRLQIQCKILRLAKD
jgi:hypothetical protein